MDMDSSPTADADRHRLGLLHGPTVVMYYVRTKEDTGLLYDKLCRRGEQTTYEYDQPSLTTALLTAGQLNKRRFSWPPE